MPGRDDPFIPEEDPDAAHLAVILSAAEPEEIRGGGESALMLRSP